MKLYASQLKDKVVNISNHLLIWAVETSESTPKYSNRSILGRTDSIIYEESAWLAMKWLVHVSTENRSYAGNYPLDSDENISDGADGCSPSPGGHHTYRVEMELKRIMHIIQQREEIDINGHSSSSINFEKIDRRWKYSGEGNGQVWGHAITIYTDSFKLENKVIFAVVLSEGFILHHRMTRFEDNCSVLKKRYGYRTRI